MRQYSLQLPQELEKGKRYPLLLWNDALPETLAALLSDMFVLSVVSEERTADFSPWPQPAFRADAKPFEGKADVYHRELFWEKLPELLTKYPIDAERIAYGGVFSRRACGSVQHIPRDRSVCRFFALRFFLVSGLCGLLRADGNPECELPPLSAKRQTRGRRASGTALYGRGCRRAGRGHLTRKGRKASVFHG